MTLDLISHLLTAASLILLLLCLLPRRRSMIRHVCYAIALTVCALLHGLMANDAPAMLSGKIAWIALMLLILSAVSRRMRTRPGWTKVHRILSACVFLLILVPILHAVLT